MTASRSKVNDPDVVTADYASEARFLARRLATWATLDGPIVEDVLVETIGAMQPRRALEVGCGTGDLTARVAAAVGGRLVATDLSPRMAELTRARAVTTARCDIQSLPFASGAFGCVLANRVLYHLPEIDRGLSEIRRVLQPGAPLLAVTYDRDHLAELRALGRPRADLVDDPTGAALARAFGMVECRDLTGRATFPTRASLEGFLAGFGEFSWFAESDGDPDLDAVSFPFAATYRHLLYRAA